jgi:DEAD/DEAH box helicase domain-containing protein
LFDAVPGGVGLAERMYERAEELVDSARALIGGCACEAGCPACIGPGEVRGRKALALGLLRRLSAEPRSDVRAVALDGALSPLAP